MALLTSWDVRPLPCIPASGCQANHNQLFDIRSCLFVTFGSLDIDTPREAPNPGVPDSRRMSSSGNSATGNGAASERPGNGVRILADGYYARSGAGGIPDLAMPDVVASDQDRGLAGVLDSMQVPREIREAVTQRVIKELAEKLAAKLSDKLAGEQRDVLGLPLDGKKDVQKDLRAKFPAPEKDTWKPERCTTYCKEVGKFLLARGIALDTQQSANIGFACLPDAVQTHITPADVEKHDLYGAATAFASWEAIVATIKEKYGARTQKNILHLLQTLRMTRGKVRQFKEKFFELKKELDDGYCPSANDLLGIVQGAMYAELAAQEAVKWSMSPAGLPVSWKPAQYETLINVCVNVDDLLADAATGGKSKFIIALPDEGEVSSGKDKDTGASNGKRRKRKAQGSAGATAVVAVANGGPSGRSSADQKPSAAMMAFKKIKWADPAVQDAADKGHCINCLKPGHMSKDCSEKRVKRARLGANK